MKLRMTTNVLVLLLSCLLVSCPAPVTSNGGPSTPETISVTTATLSDAFKGLAYTPFTLQASGGVPASYSWQVSAGALPAGLTLAANGQLSGTPTAAGNFSFTARVTDGASGTGSRALSLFVDAIAVGPPALVCAQNSIVYSQSITASRGTAPYTFAISSGSLPSPLTLNPATGAISGIPSVVGNSTFTIRVTDSNGATNDKTFILRVINGTPVAVTTASCPNSYVNGAYATTLAATGGSGALAWSLAAGALPAGVSLNPATGALTGTATTAGTSTFTVQAADPVLTDNFHQKEFTVIVRASVAITTTTCTDGTASLVYSQALAVSGGSGTSTWSIASGSLPAGLSINTGTGAISGTPSATGTSSFTVRAADTESPLNTDDQALSITVAAHVTIQTANLPSIGANRSYSQTLSATAGSGTYTWSISSGSLPQDLSLNTSSGAITGYAARPGTYSFTVRCEDSSNALNYDTRALSIQVTNCAWAFMVYLNGDNNLEPEAFDDLNEMEFADLRGTGIKVLALMDGNGAYYTGAGAFSGTCLYEIQFDAAGAGTNTGIVSRRLASTELGLTATGNEELNMADPLTVSRFLAFTKAGFTADNYGLLVFNHGYGWDIDPAQTVKVWKNLLTDATSFASLSAKQLGTVLSGQGLGVVGFDSGLAGMLEIAYEFKDGAQVFIGSEEQTPGSGWEYDFLLEDFAAKGTRTAEEFGKSAVTTYQALYTGYSGATISAIRLSAMSALDAALDTFVTNLSANFTTVYPVVNAAGAVQRYDSDWDSGASWFRSNIDLYDFAGRLSSIAGASAVQTAVTNAVIQEFHSGATVANSHGLSIYFPQLNIALGFPAMDYTPANLLFATDNGWDEYIHTFWRGPDTYEPNDEAAFATPITKNVTYSAYLTFPGNRITVYEDWDFYSINVTTNGTFTITLDLRGNTNLDAGIYLLYQTYPNTSIAVAEGHYAGENETLTFDTSSTGTGTYYIAIIPYDPAIEAYDRANYYTIRVAPGTAVIQ
jgi:hypothetical protein